MKLVRSLLGACALALAAFTAFTPDAAWSAYPDRPLKLIVPFPAGGTVDVVARELALHLGKQLGGTVVVENVPGAGGTIAGARVAKAAPDGYTLLLTTPNHTINPALMARLPYDTERDFAPVSLVAEIPELLVANAAQPFSDFAGFVQYARAHPGALAYSSAGNGTLPHVSMELLLQRLGVRVMHVPYKGAAPAMTDLLGGQVAVKMDTIATSAPHIRAGRLRPLALASARRSPLLPDVPTVAESGVTGYRGILWMGVLAPAQTDTAIVSTLQSAIATVARSPEFRKRLTADGVDVVGSDASTFARQIHAELQQWADVIKQAGIKGE